MGDGDREAGGHRGGTGDPGGDQQGEPEGSEMLWSGAEFDVPVVRGAQEGDDGPVHGVREGGGGSMNGNGKHLGRPRGSARPMREVRNINCYLYLRKNKSSGNLRFDGWWEKYCLLSNQERAEIDGVLQLLHDYVPRLGLIGSFELMGALSDWMAKNPEAK